MITIPDLIKTLIKDYDELNDLLLNHIDNDYIIETPKIHRLIGRIGAFKECILDQTEEEQDGWTNELEWIVARYEQRVEYCT